MIKLLVIIIMVISYNPELKGLISILWLIIPFSIFGLFNPTED